MTSFDRFRKRHRRRVLELGAVEAALREGRPSAEDPALQALQDFALMLRAGAPEPREAFLESLDERFGHSRAHVAPARLQESDAARSRPGTVRVVVVAEDAVVRGSLARKLDRDPGIEVVGAATDSGTAMALARGFRPDVMLLDHGMSVAGALECLRAELPDIRTLVVMADARPPDLRDLLDAVAAGAGGCVSSGTTGEDLCRAVVTVSAGGSVISPELDHLLLAGFNSARGDPPGVPTNREREILRLVADGLTDNEVREQLEISRRTVQHRLNRIREKLGFGRSRTPGNLPTFGATAANDDDPPSG